MDRWQSLDDRLTSQQRQVSAQLFKMSTHDENVALFKTWLQDVEHKMKRNVELQPTLQAKKSVLQNVKVTDVSNVS